MPKVLNDRFRLYEEVRPGGMATVTKAFDMDVGQVCAIKRMKPTPDEMRWKESFHRERSALQDLSEHPNIVRLFDVGVDEEDRSFFMALEWMPESLKDKVERDGAMRWTEFFARVGKPVLEAIVFAQARRWVHRDIKPSNILLTEDGCPKVSDYGIAKNLNQPQLGLTFRSYRSGPFSPPEDDDGTELGFSRDCYSFAVVAVYCLVGRMPNNYAELEHMLGGLDRSEAPVDILRTALSNDPAERPPMASALLADLEGFEEVRLAAARMSAACCLQLDAGVRTRIMRAIEASDPRAAERLVEDELNEAFGIKAVDVNGVRAWRISAVSWVFEAVRSKAEGRMLVVKAWPSSPAEVERHREAAYRPALRFVFAEPDDLHAAAQQIDELFLQLDAFEAESLDAAKVNRKGRLFRLLYGFLRAKADFEARRENSVAFTDVKRKSESMLVLRTDQPPPPDIVGQTRVVRMGIANLVFCEVTDVNVDEITVAVTSGDPSRIPRRGVLEVNSLAAERAIEKQRIALDAVNYDRAASVRLKTVLLDPAAARPASAIEGVQVPDPNFDDEKRAVLRHALGLQDIMAIKGPPGTGKTRLIGEIIVQYLERNPTHRVLLSSQTHVALDNVIDRVLKRHPETDIVRVGKLDDPKIGSVSKNLLIDRKAQAWAEKVGQRAHDFMTTWADRRGIEKGSIEIGMLAERLIRILHRIDHLETVAKEAGERTRAARRRAEELLRETGSGQSSLIAEEAGEAQQTLATIRAAIVGMRSDAESVRSRLRERGGYGVELADGDVDELSEWAAMLLGDTDEHRKCRELMQLQEDWLLRVGRSSDFHAAILATAQVVAGTCIGMAGIRGGGAIAYDLCIVDEASKATATEVLVPMSRSRKWILVGDPDQLPPFFEEGSTAGIEEFSDEEIRQTLLERFLRLLPEHSKAKLSNQHRMVRAIGDLISEVFYDRELNSPRVKPDVVLTGAFPKPVTWLSTTEFADRREVSEGRSFKNDRECMVVRDALQRINFIAVKRNTVYDVCIIAGYMAQVRAIQDAIRDHLHEWEGLRIECNTVDAFQGNEAEICIYSVARSNDDLKLGFLREKPRLNVALSRGRSALLIVGDDEFCRQASGKNPFRDVIDYIERNEQTCELRVLK